MKNIGFKSIGPYRVGYTASWVAPYAGDIVAFIKAPAASAKSILGGRRKVDMYSLSPDKGIAVKHYARGGLIGHLIQKTYFKWGKTRSQKEFEWLVQVRLMGVRAPEPIAFVSQGRLFYHCWLITEEIRNHQTLVDFDVADHTQGKNIISDLTRQVGILILNRILHVDLHPGNVLIDDSGLPYIIDFDKARTFHGGKERLLNRYRSRWRRAIIKHRLDPGLIQAFDRGLKTIGEKAK